MQHMHAVEAKGLEVLEGKTWEKSKKLNFYKIVLGAIL